MNSIQAFETVRDIPYKIPLSTTEKSQNCSGKHIELKALLERKGMISRFRVCSFLWSSLNLPKKVYSFPHEDESLHVWLEVYVSDKWIDVDATWDAGLGSIFEINDWDGKSDTTLAVKPQKVLGIKESAEIMNNPDKSAVIDDLAKNGKFYKSINVWLAKIRAK